MQKVNCFLVLRLQGPFQAYGTAGKWEHRDTSMLPTKSAIVGILGSSLGYKRGSLELSQLSDSISIAVRGDKIGCVLDDFQIIQGNHLHVDSLLNGQKIEEKTKKSSKIVHKLYLEDSAYLVLISGKVDLLKQLDVALRHPKWSYTLGRSNCICSRPVFAKKDEISIITSEENIETLIRRVPFFTSITLDAIQYEIEVSPEDMLKYDSRILKRQMDNVGKYVGADYRARYIYSGLVSKKEIEECR